MKLNKKLAHKWVDALESGEYNQCQGQLCKYNPVTDEDAFCCLGVLCVVEGFEAIEQPINTTFMDADQKAKAKHTLMFADPKYKTDKALNRGGRLEGFGVPMFSKIGLTDSQSDTLVNMNDAGGKNFKQIAKQIRSYINA